MMTLRNYIEEKTAQLAQHELINLIIQSKHVSRIGGAYYSPQDIAEAVREATAALRGRYNAALECAIQLAAEWIEAGGSFYTLLRAARGDVHLPTRIDNRVAVYTESNQFGIRTMGVMIIDNTHVRVLQIDTFFAGTLTDRLYQFGQTRHVQELDNEYGIRDAVTDWIQRNRDLNGRIFHTGSFIAPYNIRWEHFTKKELALFVIATQYAETNSSLVFNIKPSLEKATELNSLLKQNLDALRTTAMDCAVRLAKRGGGALGNAILAIDGKVSSIGTLYTRPITL